MNFDRDSWKQTMNNLSENIVEKEYNWLIQQIEKALSSNPSRLPPTFYQIDIEEAKLTKFSVNHQVVPMQRNLTILWLSVSSKKGKEKEIPLQWG